MNFIKKYFKLPSDKKIYVNAKITRFLDFSLAFVYLISGLFAPSLYLISLSIFSILLGVSKSICLKALKKNKGEVHNGSIASANILIIFAGLFFSLYSVRTLFGDMPIHFGKLIAVILFITCIIRIIMMIINLIRLHKLDAYSHTIIIINLVFSLSYLSLGVISAIVAFDENILGKFMVCAIIGIAIGAIAAILGLINLLFYIKKRPEFDEKLLDEESI